MTGFENLSNKFRFFKSTHFDSNPVTNNDTHVQRLSPSGSSFISKVKTSLRDMRASNHTARLTSAMNWAKNKMPVFYVKHEIEKSLTSFNNHMSFHEVSRENHVQKEVDRLIKLNELKLQKMDIQVAFAQQHAGSGKASEQAGSDTDCLRCTTQEELLLKMKSLDCHISLLEKQLKFVQDETGIVIDSEFHNIHDQSISQSGLLQQLESIQTQLSLKLLEFNPSLKNVELKSSSSEILSDRFDSIADLFENLPKGLIEDSSIRKLRSEFEIYEKKFASAQYALSDLQNKIALAKNDLNQLRLQSMSNILYSKQIYFQVKIQKINHDEAFNVYGRLVPGGFGQVTFRQLEKRINQYLCSEKASRFTNPVEAIKKAQEKVFTEYFQTSVQVKTVALGLGMVAAGTGVGATAAVVGGAIGGAAGIGAAVALYGFTHLATKPMKQDLKEFISQSQISMKELPSRPDDRESRISVGLDKESGNQSSGDQINPSSPSSVYSETFEALPNAIKDQELAPRPLNSNSIMLEITKDKPLEFLDPVKVSNFADRNKHFEDQIKEERIPVKDLMAAYNRFWSLEKGNREYLIKV